MRLQIYVPQAQALAWDPDATAMTWTAFQRRVADIAFGVSVTALTGVWKGKLGFQHIPVFLVDALIPQEQGARESYVWELFRTYAAQLIRQGEESVLVVQDNEPTLIKA